MRKWAALSGLPALISSHPRKHSIDKPAFRAELNSSKSCPHYFPSDKYRKSIIKIDNEFYINHDFIQQDVSICLHKRGVLFKPKPDFQDL
ncbi:MAG: hypothetical protein CMI18_06360 [Opitutaceae bacterium]|nr:hypothetical protein [Opitutaceae bacterium]